MSPRGQIADIGFHHCETASRPQPFPANAAVLESGRCAAAFWLGPSADIQSRGMMPRGNVAFAKLRTSGMREFRVSAFGVGVVIRRYRDPVPFSHK
jgi:hypothetical protein